MRRILVYGASIFLEGMATELGNRPEVQILRSDALAGLGLSALDAVLVDLNDTCAADVMAMLRARPDLRVIGVNAATGAVTTLAGHVYLAQTVEEVMACLKYLTED